MVERRVTVGSRVGLHARPASLFVQAATRQPVRVLIAKDGANAVDARSILSVLAMNARAGDTVVLSADGDGAEEALDVLAAVLATDHDAKAAGAAAQGATTQGATTQGATTQGATTQGATTQGAATQGAAAGQDGGAGQANGAPA